MKTWYSFCPLVSSFRLRPYCDPSRQDGRHQDCGEVCVTSLEWWRCAPVQKRYLCCAGREAVRAQVYGGGARGGVKRGSVVILEHAGEYLGANSLSIGETN